MNILFTKKNIDKKLISKILGDQFCYDFVNVIRIKNLSLNPFDLKGHSLIFTSENGVEAFFENRFKPNEKFTEPSFNKIYCVGKKTKNALRKHGFGTFKLKKHAQDLAEFIVTHSQNESFLHFCGNLALDVLSNSLPLQNITYKKIPIYETELIYPKLEQSFDAVVFFSPSGVRSYMKFNVLDGKKIFSIGHTTEKELRKYTNDKIYTSQESTFEDLLSVISKTLKEI